MMSYRIGMLSASVCLSLLAGQAVKGYRDKQDPGEQRVEQSWHCDIGKDGRGTWKSTRVRWDGQKEVRDEREGTAVLGNDGKIQYLDGSENQPGILDATENTARQSAPSAAEHLSRALPSDRASRDSHDNWETEAQNLLRAIDSEWAAIRVLLEKDSEHAVIAHRRLKKLKKLVKAVAQLRESKTQQEASPRHSNSRHCFHQSRHPRGNFWDHFWLF
ncbi:MAG: hypothetical protein LBG20_01205 [Holosporaceae bacterium]|nr:hypothetical protein [Holosporaceae bacterium]